MFARAAVSYCRFIGDIGTTELFKFAQFIVNLSIVLIGNWLSTVKRIVIKSERRTLHN